MVLSRQCSLSHLKMGFKGFEGHPLLYCHFKELICVFAPLFALDSTVMIIYSFFLKQICLVNAVRQLIEVRL